jgi:tetratricopeptide (TPR) repeat protein
MLSVCLIAKNEERHLARCLESVLGLADEIVLVDTGSTDGTVEIAQAYGARVFHFTWQDDFSLARNVSIAQAKGEWILAIDADETIAERDHAVIRSWLRRDDLHAVTSTQRHYLASGTVVGWQPGPGGYEEGRAYPGFVDNECRRLFRNRPWLRFRNRVHEELVSFDPAKALMQERADWVIHHFGKVGEQELLRAKGEAYLRMGLKKIEDSPEDPLAHYELGVQYAELGRPQDAIGPFERTLELSPRFRDARLRIALCHKQMGNHAKALETLRAAAWTLPRYATEIAFEEGNAHRALGDIVAAEGAFRRAISMNAGFVPASVNLAVMLHGAGRTAEAVTCLERALQQSPQNGYLLKARAHIGGAFVRSLLQRQSFEEARNYLTAVVDAVAGSSTDARIFEHVRAGRFELAKRMLEKSA